MTLGVIGRVEKNVKKEREAEGGGDEKQGYYKLFIITWLFFYSPFFYLFTGK